MKLQNWTNVRQTLDMDIPWTKSGFRLFTSRGQVPTHLSLDKNSTNIGYGHILDKVWMERSIARGPVPAHCPPKAQPLPVGQTLDKLWTNNEQTMDKQWTKYGFYKFPRFLPWAARGPLIASHGPLIANLWPTYGPLAAHLWPTHSGL